MSNFVGCALLLDMVISNEFVISPSFHASCSGLYLRGGGWVAYGMSGIWDMREYLRSGVIALGRRIPDLCSVRLFHSDALST
jgi:hypothetical protein